MESSSLVNYSVRGWIATAWCAAIFAGLLAAAPAAAGKAGALDRSFNGDGKVVTTFPRAEGSGEYVEYRLPFEFAPGRVAMASAGGGRVVAANSRAIVMYVGSGRRNPYFGGNGAVPIEGVEGSRFQLADVAVDSRGRVLVAGTTRPKTRLGMGGRQLPGPIPSMVTVRRYLPNGQPDPGFGSGGVVHTDLGAAPPTLEGQPYSGTAVAVVGLAVDGSDRPILTGSAVAEIGRCSVSKKRYEASQAFVARLATDGARDASFDSDGLRTIGGLSWLGSPSAVGGEVVTAGTRVDPCRSGGPANPSVLVRLGQDGGLDQAFSGGGFWSRAFTRIADVAAMRSGKLVLLVRTIELRRGKWVESRGEVVRLRQNGSFDASFGTGGRAELGLPRRGSVAAIATDRAGRVLLAGTVPPNPKVVKRGKRPGSKFLLMRLAANGDPDRGFGRRGRTTTGFGLRMNVRGTEVFVDPAGRVLVGGKLSGPSTGGAFALARYRSGG